MSTTPLSQPSSISSMCSSFSSFDGSSTERKRKLLSLLTQPRENGGYGGRINYHEFSLLGHSLNWTREVIEDCWYDVLRGVPTLEATDMQHVADVVCDYCSPSTLVSSMTPPVRPDLAKTELVRGLPKSADSSQSGKPAVGLDSPAPPVLVHAAAGVRPRSCTRTCCSGNTNRRTPSAQSDKERCSITSGLPKPIRRSSKLALRGNQSPGCRRYAVQTASSKLKLRTRSPSLAASGNVGAAPRQPTPRRNQPSPRTGTPKHSAVFDRLYEHGKKFQLERKAWTKPLEEMPSFKPSITPCRGGRHTKEENADAPHYHKLTCSHCAKLMQQPDRHHDPLDDTPATARVDFRAPPGPSCFVPPGYVEGVARLRRGVAARQLNDFVAGLRQDSCSYPFRDGSSSAAIQCLEAPILRLPLYTIEKGAKESVDVRLASHDDKISGRSNDAYNDGRVSLATPTRPRSFSASSSHASYFERFKTY
ncbi:unnamed protein product [Phytomonas sp. EM1]|nr:unnamed protein product [Phytomonas sp. EM1]|eukprot:CCW63004.1 unnamed protein product [Phytomonas sp. isolate EM1]